MEAHKFTLLTLSGIDGAGKSTQIDALLSCLRDRGCRVHLYTFWDDLVAFSRHREKLSLHIFKGEKGIGSPDRPIARRDKNVTSWYVVMSRLFLYFLDALRLSAIIPGRVGKQVDFVICDRYLYDEMANLPLQYWLVRRYVRFLLRIIPRPDIAFLLDADPETAVSRKPEYPLDFVRRNRDAYRTIAEIAGMCVLPPASVSRTSLAIEEAITNLQRERHSELCHANPLSMSSAKTPSS